MPGSPTKLVTTGVLPSVADRLQRGRQARLTLMRGDCVQALVAGGRLMSRFEDESDSAAQGRVEPTREPARVLFVGDDQMALEGLRLILSTIRYGWHLAFAVGAEAAIAALEVRRFDVVVMDVNVSGVAGRDLLSLVRDRWPGIRRIVLCGDVDDQQSLTEIAHTYIAKPCSLSTLVEAIAVAAEIARD
jgi:CheY-like chemotaxis protein